ncbi:hypothetical protein [Streptomyces sp. 8N706]|uniref:hypothetical protein n=1 Tax=Streptomyces sp. 8N706 TaxID=3457416 RepID=UPI003FD1495C
MVSAGDHIRAMAHVVRADFTDALIALPAWLGGQVLVHMPVGELAAVTGRLCDDLPGTRLTVLARLDALLEEDLELQDWRVQTRREAA